MEWTTTTTTTTTWPEMMEELIQSREMMNQLEGALRSDDVRSAEGLVTKIMGSLTNTLVVLNKRSDKEEPISQVVRDNGDYTRAVTAAGSAIVDGADSSSSDIVYDSPEENLNEESCKRAAQKCRDRTGFNKRRRTLHTWTKETLVLVDDGHTWRKYGQKMIRNTKHSRNYFRCTHKYDQGCKATKHVQMMQVEPQLYRTTYYANHTCTDYLSTTELILDCPPSREDYSSHKNMIRFDNVELTSCKQEHPFFKTLASIKKEEEEMIKPMSSDHEDLDQSSSLTLGKDLLEPSGEPLDGFSSTLAYDHGDLISSMMDEYLRNEADFQYGF